MVQVQDRNRCERPRPQKLGLETSLKTETGLETYSPVMNKCVPKLRKHATNRHKQENDTMKSICWKKVAKLGRDTLQARKFFLKKY